MASIAGRFAGSIRETADLVVFRHSVFALPFAVIALITADDGSWPTARTWLWVVVAMVSARTAAMSFNRLVDHEIDAENPRTAERSLPAGRLSRRFAWSVTAIAAALFLIAAAMLNQLCLVLAVPTLAVLLGYSYSKRFTAACHLWLGVALGLAPIGAWIAVTGQPAWPPVILAAAVVQWVAGFDIIYSLQDESFDRAHGLRSLAALVGARRALRTARLLHLGAFVCFLGFALVTGGGVLRLTAVAAAGAMLGWQHRLVAPERLDAVDAAFFTANGVLSLLMCGLFVLASAGEL
jgi:4-hydroxybenzoate polyprenyltransferase